MDVNVLLRAVGKQFSLCSTGTGTQHLFTTSISENGWRDVRTRVQIGAPVSFCIFAPTYPRAPGKASPQMPLDVDGPGQSRACSASAYYCIRSVLVIFFAIYLRCVTNGEQIFHCWLKLRWLIQKDRTSNTATKAKPGNAAGQHLA